MRRSTSGVSASEFLLLVVFEVFAGQCAEQCNGVCVGGICLSPVDGVASAALAFAPSPSSAHIVPGFAAVRAGERADFYAMTNIWPWLQSRSAEAARLSGPGYVAFQCPSAWWRTESHVGSSAQRELQRPSTERLFRSRAGAGSWWCCSLRIVERTLPRLNRIPAPKREASGPVPFCVARRDGGCCVQCSQIRRGAAP